VEGGNSVLVVEHDEEIMQQADYIIDIGPGAGEHGGSVVFTGTYPELLKDKKGETGAYVSGRKQITIPQTKKAPTEFIEIIGASENNLKNVDVKIPLEVFTVVTGVSGSGKSSLIIDTLSPYLHNYFNRTKLTVGKAEHITGIDKIDKFITIDQSPIGRTPHSNVATYTGLFTPMRELFAETMEAKRRGYKVGRFSFNTKGGRCEICEGAGVKKIEMYFLPDMYVTCDACGGTRFNEETLSVKWKGKNIADVLNMTVDDACDFFTAFPKIYRILDLLKQVGLGYITLGQPAPTFSGGEAQRIKLAFELAKRSTTKTLYILDEPTTGLHFSDIQKLLDILHKLVVKGNSVLVIEHNLDVIANADYVIDLGPDGGNEGGQICYQGPLKGILKAKTSYTGQELVSFLKAKKGT